MVAAPLRSWRLRRWSAAGLDAALPEADEIEHGNSLDARTSDGFGAIGWVLGTEFATI
jgi:hypothetical protein